MLTVKLTNQRVYQELVYRTRPRADSAALPLQGFLSFYFRVVRAFSILWTRLSRSLEQAILDVLRLRNTISFFFSKPFCAKCLVNKAVHCQRRLPFSLLLRKKSRAAKKMTLFYFSSIASILLPEV